MKKSLLLALVAILISASTFAGNGGHSYTAFTATYSYQDVKNDYTLGDYSLYKDNFKLHGFSIGFIVHQQLISYLYLTSGLNYQFTMKSEDVDYVGDCNLYNHDIKIPIKLAFSMTFGGKSGFSIHAGPSLDFMVGTVYQVYTSSKNNSYTDFVSGRNVIRANGDKYINNVGRTLGWFDIPLGVGATLNFGNFGLRFDYEWGMVNRSLDKNYKWKADQLTAGLFFIF